MTLRLLATLSILFALGCGPSPWSKYEGEDHGAQLPFYTKIEGNCRIEWIRGPFKSTESEFNLHIPAILDTAPEVKLWMPSMGHGSAPTTVADLGNGNYNVQKVYFIMSGDWEIQVNYQSNSICRFGLDIK